MRSSGFFNSHVRGWQGDGESDKAFRARIRKREQAKIARRKNYERAAQKAEENGVDRAMSVKSGVAVAVEHYGIPLPAAREAEKASLPAPVQSEKMTRKQHRMLLLTNFREFCAAGTIQDKERRKVPFLWNRPQRRLNMLLAARLATGKPVYAAVAKARRWGCSLDVTWWMGWQMARCDGTAVIVVLHHKDYLDEFRVRYRQVFESLPEYVVGQITVDNAQKMVLSNGSRVDFYTAGTAATASQVGRSTGYHWCHATEVPFWHAPDKTFTAMMGSMQLGPHTGVIVESTPAGAFGRFYEMYMQAKRGESDYMAYFVPWHHVEDYVLNPTRDQIIAWDKWRESKNDKYRLQMGKTPQGKPIVVADEEGRIDRYGLTCGQYLWWCDTYRNKCNNDINQMKQEFGDDDVTCFLTAAKLGFDQDELALIKHQCDTGREHWRDCGVIEGERGELVQVFDSRVFRVRKPPEPKAEYIALLDPALGGQTADFSVLYVFKRTIDSLELVAKCKTRAMPDGCVDMMHRLLRWYGEPLLGVESNRGEGHIHEFRVRNYPRLLRRARTNVITGMPMEDALGLYMSDSIRQVCIKNLHKYIRTGRLQIPDDDLHSEMHTFVLDESSGRKYAAAKGCFDDHVMTAAMACYLDETYPIYDTNAAHTTTPTYVGAAVIEKPGGGFMVMQYDAPMASQIVKQQRQMDYD